MPNFFARFPAPMRRGGAGEDEAKARALPEKRK
jgi:hypothetical protein